MKKTPQLLLVFIPALMIVALAFVIRVYQYEPLYPDFDDTTAAIEQQLSIPIFGDDPILGKKSAPITIITFEDFACQRCADQMTLFRTLLAQYPDKIKIIFKGLPVTRVPHSSEPAHAYGYCANQAGRFPEFEQLAFANSSNLTDLTLEQIADDIGMSQNSLKNCLSSNQPAAYQGKVEALARSLQIQSVPTVFLNNTQVQSPGDLSGWKSILGLE